MNMPSVATVNLIRKRALSTFTVIAIGWSLFGCHYDVREELYGPPSECETPAEVSYSGDVAPLLDTYCNNPGCHGDGGFPNLTLHASVSQSAVEGSLLERIRKPSSDPLSMPKNGDQLPECDLRLFERWVENGAPEN